MWDFETDPQYQEKLDWVTEFMRTEVEPLDFVALDPYDKKNPDVRATLRPLQQQVRERGLWAAHLTPELGGQGYGQVKLALLNENPGPVPLGAVGVRLSGPGFGQRGDPRAVRHRRAEAALPATAARR